MEPRYDTYLINLDRAAGRLDYMSRQLDGLGMEYERVPAIDGKKLALPIPDFDLGAYRRLHGRNFHPGEVGCYLSHIKALRMFLQSDASHALILEDDAELPADLRATIGCALEARDEWDLLRLSTVNSGLRIPYRRLDDKHGLALALTREKGAAAYMVNRRCAERFLDKLVPMWLAWDIAFDIEYLYGLRSVFVEPPPVNQFTGMETQIQMHTAGSKLPATRYFTVFPYRVHVETRRFAIRGLRLLALLWRNRKARRAG